MLSQDTINQFIALRSRGISYDKIAEQLHIGKATAVAWGRQYKAQIYNARLVALEALQEKLLGANEDRYKNLIMRLKGLEQEMADRTPSTCRHPNSSASSPKRETRSTPSSLNPPSSKNPRLLTRSNEIRQNHFRPVGGRSEAIFLRNPQTLVPTGRFSNPLLVGDGLRAEVDNPEAMPRYR
jgi:hypothetical protein